MKKFNQILCASLLALTATIGASSYASAAPNPNAVKYVATDTGQTLSLSALADNLFKYDVIFFGEYHDQDTLHKAEYELMKKLYILHGDRLALSLEMFEIDVQPLINGYLKGEITEESLLAHARPWPRYKKDYHPLVNFAKFHKLQVIAANLPRRLARHMAQNGDFSTVARHDRAYLPIITTAPQGAYHDKFFSHMQKLSQDKNSPMRMSSDKMALGFQAQCAKDDKMAQSIYSFKQYHTDKIIYHINGAFHSDRHLGTVERLQALNPSLSIAVITPKDLNEDIAKNYEEHKKDGEYIVYFPRKTKEEVKK